MPREYCSYTAPLGGMFLWLTFRNLGDHNAHLTSFDLFKRLCDAGVICVPGDDFFVPDIHTCLGEVVSHSKTGHEIDVRVTFAASTPLQIREAIEKMSKCIRSLVEQKRP